MSSETDIAPERLQNFYRYLKPLKCTAKVHSAECRTHKLALTLGPADLWEWADLLGIEFWKTDDGYVVHVRKFQILNFKLERATPIEATRAAVIAALEKWEQERE